MDMQFKFTLDIRQMLVTNSSLPILIKVRSLLSFHLFKLQLRALHKINHSASFSGLHFHIWSEKVWLLHVSSCKLKKQFFFKDFFINWERNCFDVDLQKNQESGNTTHANVIFEYILRWEVTLQFGCFFY